MTDGVAVAGTPTSFAAIEQSLDPYDPERVDGYRLDARRASGSSAMLARTAAGAAASKVPGLHPDRAPTIVAGGHDPVETMAAFGLESMEVSERDILEGVAIEAAGVAGDAKRWKRAKSRKNGLNVQFGKSLLLFVLAPVDNARANEWLKFPWLGHRP